MSDSRYFGFERQIETAVSLHREEDEDGRVTVSMVVSEHDPSTGENRRMVVRMVPEDASEMGAAIVQMAGQEAGR